MGQRKRLMNDIKDIKMIVPEVKQRVEHVKDIMKEKRIVESLDNADGYLDPTLMGSDQMQGPMDQYQHTVPNGFNENDSCIPCGGSKLSTELNSQCGSVKTWENTLGAQGLDAIPGIQSSVGYPV